MVPFQIERGITGSDTRPAGHGSAARYVSAMGRLGSIVAGRRSKWAVIVLWVVAVAALAPLGAKLADVTTDETTAFLPASAESTEVQKLLKERFGGGETATGLIVYHRDGGLTAADKAKIAHDAQAIDRTIPVTRPSVVPFTA